MQTSLQFHIIVLPKYYKSMTKTTTNSMNFLLEDNDDQLSVKMPKSMKIKIGEAALLRKMKKSRYVKFCISEQLERDLNQ